jgi:hypothetical protein
MTGVEPSVATMAMRDQARSRILAALGEPDLSENDGIAELQARRSEVPPTGPT